MNFEPELSVNRYLIHIPKLVVYFFVTLHVLFGFDCGFLSDLRKKYYPWFEFLFGIISTMYFINSTIPLWGCDFKELGQVCHIIQYGLFILIFSLSKYNISNFLFDIISIENNHFIGIHKIFNISLMIYSIFITFINCAIFFIYVCFIKTSYLENIFKCTIAYISTFSVDMVPVIQIIILRHIYICVKKLQRMTIESNFAEIRQFYVDIANFWDKIKPLYYKLVFTSVITSTPKLMWKSWIFLRYNKINSTWYRSTFQLFQTTSILFHLTVPAVCVQLIKYQVKRTKLQLLDKMFESSENCKAEIREVIQYINTRPIAEKAWDLMPIDVTLLTNIFSVTVTYLIVIIQFSHLYD